MRSILGRIFFLALAAAGLYLLLNPTNGVIYQGPLAVLGTALIGLGLCREALDRAGPACEAVRR